MDRNIYRYVKQIWYKKINKSTIINVIYKYESRVMSMELFDLYLNYITRRAREVYY